MLDNRFLNYHLPCKFQLNHSNSLEVICTLKSAPKNYIENANGSARNATYIKAYIAYLVFH